MNPESLKTKILISLVDKFLIGLAASGLLLYFQYAQRQTERMDQERRAVGSVWTDEVADQRTKLATGVSDLMELVDRLAPTGRARDADAERLDDVVRDIGGSISMLRRVRSCIPSFCRRQITPKTSRYTRCSSSMLPNVSINGRTRSSGQLGRW